MSALELKGEIHELISQVRDEPSARKLLTIIKSFLQDSGAKDHLEDDFEENMTPEQIKALERAIARSYDRRNYVSSQAAEEKLAQWLKP